MGDGAAATWPCAYLLLLRSEKGDDLTYVSPATDGVSHVVTSL